MDRVDQYKVPPVAKRMAYYISALLLVSGLASLLAGAIMKSDLIYLSIPTLFLAVVLFGCTRMVPGREPAP